MNVNLGTCDGGAGWGQAGGWVALPAEIVEKDVQYVRQLGCHRWRRGGEQQQQQPCEHRRPNLPLAVLPFLAFLSGA